MPNEGSFEVRYNRLKTQLQNAILTNYPNPERLGCLGSAILKELAARPVDECLESFEGDPHWQHVTHCSECYREFLAFLEEVRREHRMRRARTILVFAVVVVIAVGVFFGVWEVRQPRRPRNAELAYRPHLVDLEGRAVTRGESTGETKPLVLQREPEELTIRLPLASPEGTYEIQIERTVDNPLLSASGQAKIENGTTMFKANMDLSKLEAGSYFLCIRRVPYGSTCYPVAIH